MPMDPSGAKKKGRTVIVETRTLSWSHKVFEITWDARKQAFENVPQQYIDDCIDLFCGAYHVKKTNLPKNLEWETLLLLWPSKFLIWDKRHMRNKNIGFHRTPYNKYTSTSLS